MWHGNEIITIFKSYIEEYSVDSLKDKKKACSICNDLLYEYEKECKIFRVLFNEGIGDLLPTSFLMNQHDINIFIKKIENFVKEIGFDNQVVIATSNIIKKLFCDTKKCFYTAEYVWNIQQKKDEEYLNSSVKKVLIQKVDDWNQLIDYSKRDVTISCMYKGNTIPFNILKGMKKFSCFLPVPFVRYKELDMSQIEELYCSIIDENKDIVLNAPHLKRLSLYINDNIYERITPIERVLQFQTKVIDLSNLEELEQLEIYHSSGYSIIVNKKLKKLKKIIQTYELKNEFEWLKELPILEEYDNYNGNIDDINCLPKLEHLQVLKIERNKLKIIDNIKRYPKLKELSVNGNEINSINSDGLGNLERLDLRNNSITSHVQKEELPIPEFFLTELDYRIATLKDEFDKLFYFAYKDVKANELILRKKTELEKFVIFANDSFKQKAKTINNFSDELSNIKLRDAFIQYAYNHYDFLDMDKKVEIIYKNSLT